MVSGVFNVLVGEEAPIAQGKFLIERGKCESITEITAVRGWKYQWIMEI